MCRLLVYFISVFVSIGVSCSTSCDISGSQMICSGAANPVNMSKDIRELYLEDFDCDQLKTMDNVSHLQKLIITANKGNTYARCFYRFSNLTYLGVHVKEQLSIDQNAFEGLSTLQTLDLSSNPKLHEEFISYSLNSDNRTLLSNLEHLSISGIKATVIEPVVLNRYFFTSITAGRSLRSLDISQLNIAGLDYYSVSPICSTVEYINSSRSFIGLITTYQADYTCQSLKSLDINGLLLPLAVPFSFRIFDFFCQALKFYEHLNMFWANNINTKHDIVITNYSLDMSACPMEFKKISIAGNRIRWLNFTVHLHNTTIKGFSELNISDNGLEYASPSVLLPATNLVTLDVSKNRLHKMQEMFSEEFEILFFAQRKLRYINLSHNGLRHIPMNTFSQNKLLRTLDISFNNIKKIDFKFTQLVYLENFIVKNNKILYIEPYVRSNLQSLVPNVKVIDDKHKVSFSVYLDGNEFECNCNKENQEFITWLHASTVIDANETLNCSLDGDNIDIKRSALTATERFCRIEAMKKTAMISGPVIVAVAVLAIVIAFYTRRWYRSKLIIREVISQIEMGTFSKPYLAFLSYCSEDAELVLNAIYPKFLENLSEITNTNQQLVCIGDKNFRPGFPLRCEVMRCVQESSVLVAVISRDFCQKRFCMVEIEEAIEQNKPVIMLMIEHVEMELMDDFLRKVFDRYAHASWKPDENGGHIEPEWKVFCKSIIKLSRSTKNTTINVNRV